MVCQFNPSLPLHRLSINRLLLLPRAREHVDLTSPREGRKRSGRRLRQEAYVANLCRTRSRTYQGFEVGVSRDTACMGVFPADT